MPGDTFGFQFAYAEGASRYITANINHCSWRHLFTTTKGGTDSWGVVADGIQDAAGYHKSHGYQFEAGYEHAWTKTLKTSLAGGFVHLSYPAEPAFCAGACDPTTNVWNIGSRTKWSPVKNLNFDLNIVYTEIDTAHTGTGLGPRGNAEGNASIWTGLIRVQRVFWP